MIAFAFISTLLLTTSCAAHPATAPAPSPKTCDRNPTFTLRNITYKSNMIYSTPAHLAVAAGYIDFDLVNSDVPYVTHCSGTGMHLQNFFYGEIVYNCQAPEGVTLPQGYGTNFTFSEPDGAFQVNQTWNCKDQRRYGYVKLEGIGAGKASLKCKTVVWNNPAWTMGQLYSTTDTTCEPASLQLKPKTTEAH